MPEVMSHTQARRIASTWHGGKASPLSHFVRTGALNQQVLDDIEGAIGVAGSKAHRSTLTNLAHYARERLKVGDLGAVQGWDDLREFVGVNEADTHVASAAMKQLTTDRVGISLGSPVKRHPDGIKARRRATQTDPLSGGVDHRKGDTLKAGTLGQELDTAAHRMEMSDVVIRERLNERSSWAYEDKDRFVRPLEPGVPERHRMALVLVKKGFKPLVTAAQGQTVLHHERLGRVYVNHADGTVAHPGHSGKTITNRLELKAHLASLGL